MCSDLARASEIQGIADASHRVRADLRPTSTPALLLRRRDAYPAFMRCIPAVGHRQLPGYVV